jgi:hypothetical protein
MMWRQHWDRWAAGLLARWHLFVAAHLIETIPMAPPAIWRVKYLHDGLVHRFVFLRDGQQFARGVAATKQNGYRNARRDNRWAMRAYRIQGRR